MEKDIPFEDAISSPMLKGSPTFDMSFKDYVASKTRENIKTRMFDLMFFTRRHPYFEIVTRKLPVGSKALEDIENAAKAQSINNEGDFFKNAMKSIGNMFSADMTVSVPIPEQLIEYKTVKTTTLKKKYSTWTYPSEPKEEEKVEETIKTLWNFPKKSIPTPLHLQDVSDTVLKKEIMYLIDNAVPHSNLTLIGPANSEAVEIYLNQVFFSSYSHSDFDILVVPLQKSEYLERGGPISHDQGESLLEAINTETVCYNIIFSQKDFTVLQNNFYKSDLFFCLKTSYPFFNFYARFLSLILSMITLP
jgi:hypothetical protein